MKRRLLFLAILAVAPMTIALLGTYSIMAANTPCEFDASALLFAGSPVEQAKCLLRPNGKGGVLGGKLKRLPGPLNKLIGQKVKLTPHRLRKYLESRSISEDAIGGDLETALSWATNANGEKIPALYFVIHDTSTPYLKDQPFPFGFDTDPEWKGNKLSIWIKQPVAHVFVNRLGESLTTVPFGENVSKGWGTKFARDFLKTDAKGLQLHVELVQPRRRDPASTNPENDLIAPTPGFTQAQYERLALLYVAASVRRGSWLIPAFHSAIDAGIKDAHDDPQNFELERFASSLKALTGKINE